MTVHLFSLLGLIFSAAVQFVLFLRWLHRRMRDDEISRAFLRDMALSHLPHIYAALERLAARQGIELEETPLVRYSDLHGRHH